jgi:hypothetical protein
MSKLNRDDVLFMWRGTDDSISRLEMLPDSETFLDTFVRVDGAAFRMLEATLLDPVSLIDVPEGVDFVSGTTTVGGSSARGTPGRGF